MIQPQPWYRTAIRAVFLSLFLMGCGDESTAPQTDMLNDYPVMLVIPEGRFDMGWIYGFAEPAEMPMHTVTLSSFRISKYEITQHQYALFDSLHESAFPEDRRPVEQVSWYDAARYCNWLSMQEGLEPFYDDSTLSNPDTSHVDMDWEADGYRLPTEAQWEYACKGETTMDTYGGFIAEPGCDPLDDSVNRIAWYCGNAEDETHPAGRKEANRYGLHDMSGNVWEWCNDWNGEYSDGSQTDPCGPERGSSRIRRGGCFTSAARRCRSTCRNQFHPRQSSLEIGFRVARPADE